VKVIYIPGMSITKEELKKIRMVFSEGGIQIEPLISDYLSIAKMSKHNIERTIMDRIDSISEEDDTHLLCHSMGCNFGVLASNHPMVQSITLISPEFRRATKKEREEIIAISATKYQNEVLEKVTKRTISEQLLLVGLFLRSRKWALKELVKVEVPMMVVYSEGDPFVSRKGIDEIGDEITRKIVMETSNHNPLLSEVGPTLVKRYRHYIGG